MDVKTPEIERIGDRTLLKMYCPEERIDREIVWSGFGFQVWCQMLTHLIQSKGSSIFLIDEPDIYLHSDLQRQLIGLLRSLGPDILIATHSTEIVTEAEPDEIVLINKKRKHAKRISNQGDVEAVFRDLGSNVNPILTQLAKTKKALFVEGLDFQLMSKFATRLNESEVANRGGFAVVPLGGFNPERAKILKEGIELTLGMQISTAAVLDRDYRSDAECEDIRKQTESFCDLVRIHRRKEIENFLLVPSALDRAIAQRLADREKRTGESSETARAVCLILDEFAEQKRSYVMSRQVTFWGRYAKKSGSKKHPDQITEDAIQWAQKVWAGQESIYELIPGKEALSYLNSTLQAEFSVSVAPSKIISAMTVDDIPEEMKDLISAIAGFVKA